MWLRLGRACSLGAGVAAAVAACSVWLVPVGPAAAQTVRTEIESVTHTGTCWAAVADSGYSGGSSRQCLNDSVSTLSLPVTANSTGPTFNLYGYADANARNSRGRVDGGPWVSLTPGAPTGTFSALFWTTGPLAAGGHTVELQWVSGLTVALDFFEMANGTAGTTTTTTAAPATTTTAAPATTTTTSGPGTTTTTTAGPLVVRVDPLDPTGVLMVLSLLMLTAGLVSGSALIRSRR